MSTRRYMHVVLCDECSEGTKNIGLHRERVKHYVTVCDWCRAVFDSDFSEPKTKYRLYWDSAELRGD